MGNKLSFQQRDLLPYVEVHAQLRKLYHQFHILPHILTEVSFECFCKSVRMFQELHRADDDEYLTMKNVEDLSSYEAHMYFEYSHMRIEDAMKKPMNQAHANQVFISLFQCLILRIKYEETASLFDTLYEVCQLPSQKEEYYRIYAEYLAEETGVTLMPASHNILSETKITQYMQELQCIKGVV